MDPYFSIVTGRCRHCAASLFDDEPIELDAPEDVPIIELLTFAELGAEEHHALVAAIRPALSCALSGALLAVIGGVSAPWVKELLDTRLDEIWVPFVAPVLLAPGITVGFWALVVWARHLRVSRRCPLCAAPVPAHGYASITGNCSSCGRRVVSDPYPGSLIHRHASLNPTWSIAGFRNLAKYRHDRLWIGCLLGGGLASVWAAPFFIALATAGRSQITPEGLTAYFICMAGIILFQCGGALIWHWYSARGLRCPDCKDELLQFYGLVISSQRCYHCGATVLDASNGISRGVFAATHE